MGIAKNKRFLRASQNSNQPKMNPYKSQNFMIWNF
jgi:hypothetical protein